MKRSFLLPGAFLLLTAQAPPSDLASRELRLEIKQAEDRAAERSAALERRIDEFERQTWIVGAVSGLFGIGLTGIIPAYFLLLRKARKLAEEKLAALIEARPRALTALIDERAASLRLRRETAIVVFAEKLETQGILRGSGFANVKTLPPSVDGNASGADRNAVAVFHLDDGCSEETAAELVRRHGFEYCLAYTANRSNLQSHLQGRNVTHANSPVTLFARLMELIEYKDALERESRRP